MSSTSSQLDTIIATLLFVGERVVEVSKEFVLTRIWDRENSPLKLTTDLYLGKKVAEVRNDFIFAQCQEKIIACFATGENSYIEYTAYPNNTIVTYSIRVLNCHPDKNFVLIVVDCLPRRTDINFIEDKWKLALDASGDGVWDSNFENGKIYFSDKWFDIFGYSANEITTGAQWVEKIHPDDMAEVNYKSQQYLSGESPIYSSELRYKCKDGTYKWILSRGVVISKKDDGNPLRYIGTHTDINARKIEEEKHIATADLLSKLVNSLNDGVLVTDQNGSIVLFNDAYAQLCKNYLDPDTLIGQNIFDSLTQRTVFYKDPEFFISRTREILKDKKMSLNNEYELNINRVLRMDYIPMMVGNKFTGDIWKFTDITEQKNIAQKFENQRLFYEQILDNLSLEIAVLDKDLRFLYVNQNSIKNEAIRNWIIGKTNEEYIAYRNKPMEIAKKRTEILKKAVEKKQVIEFEEKMTDDAGHENFLLRRIYPVFSPQGDMNFIIGYGLNITELVHVREALKDSIDTFTSAFENSGFGMALISPDGQWLDVNKALCDIAGYKKEELLKTNYRDLTYIEDIDIDLPFLKQLYEGKLSTYTTEKRYITKQKTIRLISLTVSVVWKKTGLPKFFIAQIIDITEKRELEQILHRKNADLEATRISLVNKITQLEELNRIVAHNLRGPANNIKMLVGVLKAKNNTKVLGEEDSYTEAFTQEEALSFIDESSQSLSNNLETLMEITQIQLNQQIPFNECNITEIITEIIKQLHGIIYESKAIIKQNIGVSTISYPKVYLESICYNFISNALKYRRKDIVPEITISALPVNNHVQLVFKDNGLGINMAKYGNKVFKLNQVFHTGYDSKGVGLYITKTQVESLGGTIELKSKVNEGSEFIVTI